MDKERFTELVRDSVTKTTKRMEDFTKNLFSDEKMAKLKQWFSRAIVRASKTFTQSFLGMVTVTATQMGKVDVWLVLSVALVSAVASMLTSMFGLPELDVDFSDPENWKYEREEDDTE